MGRRVELGVGLFMVAGILALAIPVREPGQGRHPGPAEATSCTRTSRPWAGSSQGLPWRSPGVSVGRVQSIGLKDYQARVTLRIDQTASSSRRTRSCRSRPRGSSARSSSRSAREARTRSCPPAGASTEVEAPVDHRGVDLEVCLRQGVGPWVGPRDTRVVQHGQYPADSLRAVRLASLIALDARRGPGDRARPGRAAPAPRRRRRYRPGPMPRAPRRPRGADEPRGEPAGSARRGARRPVRRSRRSKAIAASSSRPRESDDPRSRSRRCVGPSPRARGDQVSSPDDQYSPDISGRLHAGARSASSSPSSRGA